ncbi:hypothetical protein HL42_4895 [Trichophyton rubrum]|nr:hypothetical protein HL42_4895 [Trichophyton rubrum]
MALGPKSEPTQVAELPVNVRISSRVPKLLVVKVDWASPSILVAGMLYSLCGDSSRPGRLVEMPGACVSGHTFFIKTAAHFSESVASTLQMKSCLAGSRLCSRDKGVSSWMSNIRVNAIKLQLRINASP